MAIALLAASVVDLIRARKPTRAHVILAIVGCVGLMLVAVLSHKILMGSEHLNTAKNVSMAILGFAVFVGSSTAFANKYAELNRGKGG